eukprot:1177220-Prorocentrum_minimum.AAC.3
MSHVRHRSNDGSHPPKSCAGNQSCEERGDIPEAGTNHVGERKYTTRMACMSVSSPTCDTVKNVVTSPSVSSHATTQQPSSVSPALTLA